MGFLHFIRRARRALTGAGPTAERPWHDASAQAALLVAQRRVGDSLEVYLAAQRLDVHELRVEYDAALDGFTVRGEAADEATRERVVACCVRVLGPSRVHDSLVIGPGGAARHAAG